MNGFYFAGSRGLGRAVAIALKLMGPFSEERAALRGARRPAPQAGRRRAGGCTNPASVLTDCLASRAPPLPRAPSPRGAASRHGRPQQASG